MAEPKYHTENGAISLSEAPINLNFGNQPEAKNIRNALTIFEISVENTKAQTP